MNLPIRRLQIVLEPNPRRVLLRSFLPALIVKPVGNTDGSGRVVNVFSRIMLLSDAEVSAKLAEVLEEFDERHQHIREIFEERYEQIRPLLPADRVISEERRLLLGSCFINEYSFESTALFNPSIMVAPDQAGLALGEQRFILSLRATGEGHISSITFRTGVVTVDGDIRLDPVSRFVRQPKLQPAARYDLRIFRRKLREIGVDNNSATLATENLPELFLMDELAARVRYLRQNSADPALLHAADRAILLAQSNYTVRFADGIDMSEKILFPFSQSESNGIEDARFVLFTDENGQREYLATYTAYDGNVVLPQMLHTTDFQEFSVFTLNGPAVRNKGLALFPRKIGGRYVMLGRQDSENIHLMWSDHLHFWHESQVIIRPSEPWEVVQLGNCGSPMETEVGWLVLTHGVGPMRKYCIGAVLLDRNDPARVIGRLREPLLRPDPDEREGYVPNVVYSCGGLVYGRNLILPYAISDSASRFAIIPLEELLSAMTPPR